mgnify:CR=1 FL=1|jgi:hypothetical protein
MTGLDPDVEDILEDEVEDLHMKRLMRDILDWEDSRQYQTHRKGKKNALEGFLDEYVEDRK